MTTAAPALLTLPPAAPARAARRVSTSLLAANAGLWAALREHPWVSALADGTLPDEAFARWAQQRRRFSGPLRLGLLTLRSYGPPTSLDGILTRLLEETIREPRLLRQTLEKLGAPLRDDPQPACLGYGSFFRCCAADGLAEGLTALYAMQRAVQATWAALPPVSPPGPPWHPWERHWAGEEFGKLVNGLGRSLDQLARAASPWQQQRLESIFTTTARWELALLSACWRDERWPA
jgi:thiaminase/transcriptional activator TenA